MARCKDCLHERLCFEYGNLLKHLGDGTTCDMFKNKSDFVEVKHGYWQFVNTATNYLEPPSGDNCKCSVCGFEIDVSETFFKHCPNCIAKMDLKEGD